MLSFLAEGTGRTLQEEGVFVLVLVAVPSVSSVDVSASSVVLCPSLSPDACSLGDLAALVWSDNHKTLDSGPPSHTGTAVPLACLLRPPPVVSGSFPSADIGCPRPPVYTGAPTCSAHSCTCPSATACLHDRGWLPLCL